jgi:chromosome segregation ATPase
MDRRTFSSVLDEATRQLDNDVRILKNQQATITINLQELEKTRDKLSREIIELEKRKEAVIKETQEEKEGILKSTQDKLSQAIAKETKVSTQLSELTQKTKEADDIVKSNQGLRKNLDIQTSNTKNITTKLESLVSLIKETLKDM